MQTLISAPPRTGKSLYCMSLIDQLSRKHPNRRIYTNIIGMNYPGVLTINSTPENPFDWRDLPDGSIIFFDEAHEHPAFSAQDLLGTARTDAEKKRKAEILDIGDSLTLHGHFGFDIYLITQNPKLLREQVRAACSVHYVMRRLWGLDVAMIYEFAEVQTYFANATRKQALSVKRFRYPKNLYKYYVSSNVHNIQKRVPLLYMAFFAIPIAIFALGFSKARETGFMGLIPTDDQVEEVKQNPSDPKEMGYEAQVVELDPKQRDALDKLEAESLGMTLEQYQDLKNPEKRNNQIAMVQKQYDISNPFDYSYMQPAPVITNRVFSGCLNNIAYDQQGSVIHDAPKDLCTRLIKQGDRPFNPYKQVNNYEPTMVTQNNNPQADQPTPKQNYQTLSDEEMEKYQLAKEKGLI